MGYFFALDGGGTKTAGLLAEDDRVLARATVGTIKLTRVNEDVAEARLKELLDELAEKSGVPTTKITHSCAGIGGFSIERLRTWTHDTIARLTGGTVDVCGDEDIALDAGFHGGAGILVIAGTGSIVLARAEDGSRYSTGGYGPGMADEGSGHWIGWESIHAALRAKDDGRESVILDAVMKEWKLKDLGELIGKVNETPGPDYPTLTRTVVECAEKGDAVAQDVLKRAGEELAWVVDAAYRQMQAAGKAPATLGVAFTGSVITHIQPVRAAMTAWLAKKAPVLKVMDAPVEALDGALWRCLHYAGKA
jgi:N-acetylglucosamine kinase-like BadF-type ATPase